MSTAKVLTSIIVGVATGAALGILFAPDRGCHTRKKIAKKSTDVIDAIKNGFTDVSNAIKSKYEDIKEDAMNIMEKEKAAMKNNHAG